MDPLVSAGSGVDLARPEVQRLARERFVSAFLRHVPHSQWLQLPMVCLIGLLWMRELPGSPWPMAWLVVMATVTLWQLLCTDRLVRSAPEPQQPCRVSWLLGLNGATLALPVLGFGAMDTVGRTALTMIFLSIATLAVLGTSGYRGAYRAIAWPLLAAGTAGWWWVAWRQHDPVPAMAGLSIAFFGFFLQGMARHASELFLQGCAWRVDEQRRSAELQAALEAADLANQAKTQFLAAASHDLRQPMHSMGVLVAALGLRPLDPAAREIVTLLGSVNQALSAQLDTLLDVSKLDAGLVRAERWPKRLDLLVSEHHDALAPVATERGLTTACDAPQAVWIDTDPRLLGRALSNLTDNALKYTPAGGRVTLTVRQDARHATVEIADTGIGIEPQEQQRVFREFYQVGNVERDRGKGLGLGLSIVQRLCRLLEADVQLTSALGRGTTVTLRFARRAAIERPPAGSPAAAAPPPGLRVLVVDDEVTVRESMALLLRGLGCEVRLADGLAQAREAAATMAPDLVLSDLRLRDGDRTGLAVIDAVRGFHPGVAAALVTGDTAPERLRELEGSGLRVLFKPVSLEQILSVLPAARGVPR